jgi:hypothetical protein
VNPDHRLCGLIHADPHGESWDSGVRAHAAECPACAAFLQAVAALSLRLKAVPALNAPMPQSLRARLLDQLAACPEAPDTVVAAPRLALVPRRAMRRALVPAALAATLVLGVMLGHNFDFGFSRVPAEVDRTIGMYIRDVTHDHYLIERIGRPLEVAITERAALSDWLSASLNFPFELPRTAGGFRLQGGRVWHTVGRLSAMAAYETDGGGRVILFAVPAANLELRGAESSFVGGTQVFVGEGWEREARVWIDGDLAMALVAMEGELPASWADTFLPAGP